MMIEIGPVALRAVLCGACIALAANMVISIPINATWKEVLKWWVFVIAMMAAVTLAR